ncbi:MAG: biopolymer transporter ExbD [Acaryochloridaceae cyanobacterium CSU_3_4]|nr:biopolymer transporter ExbD [Acaryochloridaceae cyanobacterium CSU_3_4]
MRFHYRHRRSQIPVVNLVPLMDVLMSVLTFFIIISMTLSQQRSLEVQLRQNVRDQTQEMTLSDLKNQFVVNLDAKGQASQKKEPLSSEELQAKVRLFYRSIPKAPCFAARSAAFLRSLNAKAGSTANHRGRSHFFNHRIEL